MTKLIKPNFRQALTIFFKMLFAFEVENGIICKNKQFLNISQISKELSYSIAYFNDVLKLLESENILKRVSINNYKIIVINQSLIKNFIKIKGDENNAK